MKILGHIAIILIAALAVAGAATALVGNSNTSFPDDRNEGRPVVGSQAGDLASGSEEFHQPDGFHEDERDAPSLFGAVGVIQNLVIVGLIVGVVTLGSSFKGLLARLTGSFHNS